MQELHRLAAWMHIAVCLALALAFVGLALVGFSGCRTAAVAHEPEVVTVQLAAPPPTVVTTTDTVRVEVPAPTLAETRAETGTPPGATVTRPARVTVSTRPRALPPWDVPHFLGLRVDSGAVFLQLSSGDFDFLPPAKGERLGVYPHPDGTIAADLTGDPIVERVRVTVPAPRIVQQVVYPTWRVLSLAAIVALALVALAGVVRHLLPFVQHKG